MEDGFTFARYWEKHRVSDLVADSKKSITPKSRFRNFKIVPSPLTGEG